SDSTLRGHFPAEVQALAEGLAANGHAIEGTILCPAFLSAGRITIADVHYVAEGQRLVPVGEAEFATHPTFRFHESNLIAWASERGVDRSQVCSLGLEELRLGGPAYVADRLAELNGGYAVANAAHSDDLKVLALGLSTLEREGMSFICRTGPSFPG